MTITPDPACLVCHGTGVFDGKQMNCSCIMRGRYKTLFMTPAENPKDAVGSVKPPISAVPACVMSEVGLAMLEGALKYGRHNYRAADVRAEVYYDAAWRHLSAWWDYGQDFDPGSDIHHVTKAIAALTVLRDAMINGKVIDDRPPPAPQGHLTALEQRAKALHVRYGHIKPRHYTK